MGPIFILKDRDQLVGGIEEDGGKNSFDELLTIDDRDNCGK
jgi:hypothetical protein